MEDKIMLDWLNKNLNKLNLFVFKDNEKDKNIIDCYYKNDEHFGIYYRDRIQLMIDEKMEITN